MIIRVPPNKNMTEGSLIALTKNDVFIGYAEIIISTDEALMLSVDNKAVKTFNELFGEQIPFTIDFF
ncbi:hypothetical protein [Ruminiclostridium cellulolyticum]|uniref:Uncharacterized protein n=1 Tax=Ruminiclostridium cellulolyticum (strain ATCC 35319 / DSM 5812 / JCM 6584 / H10) TaxID=394503 RepID=B8I669_RUMCH|nr:hypothetical protein [Ruminiclostridium cellulolyticum]ACL76834.1 hypothetical protein Ccel_2506 [Ruminiclostridium cellulolyticum H10]